MGIVQIAKFAICNTCSDYIHQISVRYKFANCNSDNIFLQFREIIIDFFFTLVTLYLLYFIACFYKCKIYKLSVIFECNCNA
jgi:hypothetical protein